MYTSILKLISTRQIYQNGQVSLGRAANHIGYKALVARCV